MEVTNSNKEKEIGTEQKKHKTDEQIKRESRKGFNVETIPGRFFLIKKYLAKDYWRHFDGEIFSSIELIQYWS